MDEAQAASLLGSEPRSFTIDGERVDDVLIVGLGTGWIELQVPDKRGGLTDTEGPRPPRVMRIGLSRVDLLPKSET